MKATIPKTTTLSTRKPKRSAGKTPKWTSLLWTLAFCWTGFPSPQHLLSSSAVRVPTTVGWMLAATILSVPTVVEAASAHPNEEGEERPTPTQKRDRERRRQERDRRRQHAKPHPGRHSRRRRSGKNNSQDEDDTWNKLSQVASHFCLFQPPRDVLEGSVRAFQSLLLGGTVALVSVIGIPILGWFTPLVSSSSEETETEEHDVNASPESSRLSSVLAGVLVGGIAGTISAVAGMGVALFQITSGVWNTVGAVQAHLGGMRWDPRTRTWDHYDLDAEVADLAATGATRNHTVRDTSYYDRLGILPTASGKEIKRAYYQRAKDVHPDKNPDDPEEAAAEFLKLHTAYQVLSDDRKRAEYDAWGVSDNEHGADGLSFDPSIFFAVIFDFHKVEAYIGELTISSFVDGLIKLGEMGKTNQNLTPELWDQLWPSETDLRSRKRQVEIAQNLLARIQDYTAGEKTAEEFRASAQEEADRIGTTTASNFFGGQLLVTIGSGLELEAGRYLVFNHKLPIVSWPMGIFYLVSQKKNKLVRSFRSLAKTIHMAKSAIALQSSTEDSTGNRTEEDETAATEETLVDLIDMAGAYILQDIANVIKHSSWRLFYDTGVDSKTRKLRAEALQILGQEFYTAGKKNERSSLVDAEKRSGVKEKVARAFEMSQKKA